MSRAFRRNLTLVSALVMVAAICVIFPKALAFAELAARELRYFWWLVLIAAIAIYLVTAVGRHKDD